MKKKSLYSILIIVCVVGFWFFENFYTPATYSAPENTKDKTKIPAYILPSSTTGDIIHHNHYSLSYHEEYEQAEWVAYVLKNSHLTYDNRQRPYFIEDPKVKSKSADWRNYKGSGYDRGHLCPAGDRRFTEYAYNETFYTSNISPQLNSFNGGIWNKLEQKIRDWTKKEKTIYVITGGVLERGLDEIGDEDVAVPDYFYKIVLKGKKDNLEVLAFLFPHENSSSGLNRFLVSVDEIEKRTGIDFFANMDDTMEQQIEASVNSNQWKF